MQQVPVLLARKQLCTSSLQTLAGTRLLNPAASLPVPRSAIRCRRLQLSPGPGPSLTCSCYEIHQETTAEWQEVSEGSLADNSHSQVSLDARIAQEMSFQEEAEAEEADRDRESTSSGLGYLTVPGKLSWTSGGCTAKELERNHLVIAKLDGLVAALLYDASTVGGTIVDASLRIPAPGPGK